MSARNPRMCPSPRVTEAGPSSPADRQRPLVAATGVAHCLHGIPTTGPVCHIDPTGFTDDRVYRPVVPRENPPKPPPVPSRKGDHPFGHGRAPPSCLHLGQMQRTNDLLRGAVDDRLGSKWGSLNRADRDEHR
jgi:hypothetical protein